MREVMLGPFSSVIFDVEGTLVDCVPQVLQSWQGALADTGLIVSLDVLQLYSGMDSDEMLQILAPSMNKVARTATAKAQGERYRKHFLPRVKPFPGVRVLFGALKQSGKKICLATDCTERELKRYRASLKVDDLVDAIVCGDEVRNGKTADELIMLACEKLGVASADAVMVGDTPYNAEAATSRGVSALGLLTGGFAPESLSEAGCRHVARDLAEAGRILLGRTIAFSSGVLSQNRRHR